jgi:hypothetical protein
VGQEKFHTFRRTLYTAACGKRNCQAAILLTLLDSIHKTLSSYTSDSVADILPRGLSLPMQAASLKNLQMDISLDGLLPNSVIISLDLYLQILIRLYQSQT